MATFKPGDVVCNKKRQYTRIVGDWNDAEGSYADLNQDEGVYYSAALGTSGWLYPYEGWDHVEDVMHHPDADKLWVEFVMWRLTHGE